MLFLLLVTPLASALVAREMVDDTANVGGGVVDREAAAPWYAYHSNPDYVFPYSNYYQASLYDRTPEDPVIPAPFYGSYTGKQPLYEGYRILAKDREPKEVVAALKVTEGDTGSPDELNKNEKHHKLDAFVDNKAVPV